MPVQDPNGTPLNPLIPEASPNVFKGTESVTSHAVDVASKAAVETITDDSTIVDSLQIPNPIVNNAQIPNPLPIDPVFQEGRDWCWVACMSMALTFLLKKPVSQCEVITKVREKTHIITDAEVDICSEVFDAKTQSCNPKSMKEAWEAFKLNSVDAQLGTTDHPNRPKFVDIVKELSAGRPIEAGFVWFAKGGHAVLIKGSSLIDGSNVDPVMAVWINDPLEESLLGVSGGTGLVALNVLRNGFQHGTWVHTWTGIG